MLPPDMNIEMVSLKKLFWTKLQGLLTIGNGFSCTHNGLWKILLTAESLQSPRRRFAGSTLKMLLIDQRHIGVTCLSPAKLKTCFKIKSVYTKKRRIFSNFRLKECTNHVRRNQNRKRRSGIKRRQDERCDAHDLTSVSEYNCTAALLAICPIKVCLEDKVNI